MCDLPNDRLSALQKDKDEAAIQLLMAGLRGETDALESAMEANLMQCATMALYHGRRMEFSTQHAFDALAAICLVLGDRRTEFFENIFMQRMMLNVNLTARFHRHRTVSQTTTRHAKQPNSLRCR